MKILSKEQVYEGDKLTAERQQISSTDLMERAGIQIFNWLHVRMQGAQVPIHIFCGIGNNGGDGLVVARHLINHGYNVKTYIVNYSDKRSKDFLINYDLIKQTTKEWPEMLDKDSDLPEIGRDDIIMDAVFGIGLNREADDWVKHLFDHFRASMAFTVSIDIPSGLYTDKVPKDPNGVVTANHTLSFQTPKLVFFLPQTARYTVQWEVLDIGIDQEYMYSVKTEADLIGKFEVLQMYRPRDKFAHKGQFGHALLIGGSYGKVGAITLAARSALSAGAGLVSAFVPTCGYIPLQTAFPEAMVITDTNERYITDIKFELKPSVIGIGPGMGTNPETKAAFKKLLENNQVPLVIDADAINILSQDQELLKLLPENSVLTPHNGELQRLLGDWKDDFDKLEKAKVFSKTYKVILILKGAHTIAVIGDKLYVNATGNPGMATAGCGDVLTGIITGMLAQGYDSLVASIFGIYLHGKAGDIAVETTGYQSLIASHLIEFLGDAYMDLFKRPEQPVQDDDFEEEEDE